MTSPEVVICEPLRTAVGGYGGQFRDVPAATLAATLVGELVARTGIPGDEIDDVILGQCYPSGEAPAIGRVAALDAGLPVTVTGQQIDRRCGSGLRPCSPARCRCRPACRTWCSRAGSRA